MNRLSEWIYLRSPYYLQNIIITIFNVIAYKTRRSGKYFKYRKFYKEASNFSFDELREKQRELLVEFLNFARTNSNYYKDILKNLKLTQDQIENEYRRIPIQTKENIRCNIDNIHTVPKKEAILSKTGGTTGKSLEVRFTPDDLHHRFALLDSFRSAYGYELGKKVAWFSGKSILSDKDLKKNRYWKYDFFYKIRFYSTFHIKETSIKHYIDDLNNFKPFYAVGFPSSMSEIAKWGIKNNYGLQHKMKVIFPTAETVQKDESKLIQEFFGGVIKNQYASSEGAPFILECEKGMLHMELLTGFFEVLNNGELADEGELVFTSFTTHGTPLIRYAIKDKIVLSDKSCNCGNKGPVVESIEGRINDFIYSKERGKINLGNLSNCIKNVRGVIKFQMLQDEVYKVVVKIIKDETYTKSDELKFLKELRLRLGDKIEIEFIYVDNIYRETSGKYRMVKNSLTID